MVYATVAIGCYINSSSHNTPAQGQLDPACNAYIHAIHKHNARLNSSIRVISSLKLEDADCFKLVTGVRIIVYKKNKKPVSKRCCKILFCLVTVLFSYL